MKRPIKFRGKSIDNGEWVYGYYLSDIEATLMPYVIYSQRRFHKVIPETVGQWTGLLDKNGNEIYEDDVLRHNKNLFFVRISKNQHVLLLGDLNLKTNWRSLEWCDNVSKYIEIVGNAFDNPELLS